MEQIPLSHEASAGDTNMRVTNELPQEVVQCLENARFLHLATCTDNMPHVSLMNYTYLPSSPYSAGAPVIVMTTNPDSKKMNNLVANPNVSLLVHDWVSHRPATAQRRMSGGGSPGPEHRSSLAALLFNLNTSAVSSISATINGSARLVDRGTDEERFYREKHLENNTFESEPSAAADILRRGSVAPQQQTADGAEGSRDPFLAGEEARVVVVGIKDVRISDYKGAVRDWVITAPGQQEGQGAAVNGQR